MSTVLFIQILCKTLPVIKCIKVSFKHWQCGKIIICRLSQKEIIDKKRLVVTLTNLLIEIYVMGMLFRFLSNSIKKYEMEKLFISGRFNERRNP